MKNSRFLSNLAIICIMATVGLVSCSKDENQTSIDENITKRLSTSELEVMKDEFKSIKESDEYLTFENYVNLMSEKLKCEDEDKLEDLSFLKDKEAFNSWISTNLSKTDFTSDEEALKLYDDLTAATGVYYKKFSSFYSSLTELETDEILVVLEPELQSPLNVSNSDPHANYCMDECSTKIDNLEASYASALATGPDSLTLMIIKAWYYRSYRKIIMQLNKCLSYN